jgi:hypothetical protein
MLELFTAPALRFVDFLWLILLSQPSAVRKLLTFVAHP